MQIYSMEQYDTIDERERILNLLDASVRLRFWTMAQESSLWRYVLF